jgi:hypothetical protein
MFVQNRSCLSLVHAHRMPPNSIIGTKSAVQRQRFDSPFSWEQFASRGCAVNSVLAFPGRPAGPGRWMAGGTSPGDPAVHDLSALGRATARCVGPRRAGPVGHSGRVGLPGAGSLPWSDSTRGSPGFNSNRSADVSAPLTELHCD